MNGYGRGDDKQKKEKKSIFTKETIGMTLLLFSAICFLIVATGPYLFGSIGRAITAFFVGTVGFLVYPLLVLLIYVSIVLTFGKRLFPRRFIVRGGLLVLAVFLIVHTATSLRFDGTYGAYLSGCFYAASESVAHGTGGGVLYGLVVYPVRHLLSAAGAYVLFSLLTALALYFVLLLTPLSRYLKPGFHARKPHAETAPVAFDDLPATSADPRLSASAPAPAPEPVPPAPDEAYDPHRRSREILFRNTPAESYRNNLIYDRDSQFNRTARHSSIEPGVQAAPAAPAETAPAAVDPAPPAGYSDYPAPPDYGNLRAAPPAANVPPAPAPTAPSAPESYNRKFSAQAEEERPAMPRRVTSVEPSPRDDVDLPTPSYRAPTPAAFPSRGPAPETPVSRTEFGFGERETRRDNPFEETSGRETRRDNPFEETSARETRRDNPFEETNARETRRDNPFEETSARETRRDNPFEETSGRETRRDNPFEETNARETRRDNPFEETSGRETRRENPFEETNARETRRDNPFEETSGSPFEEPSARDPFGEEERTSPFAEPEPLPSADRRGRSSAADLFDGDEPAVPQTRGERGLHSLPEETPAPAAGEPKKEKHVYAPYVSPSLEVFHEYENTVSVTPEDIERNSSIIVDALRGFKVDSEVVGVIVGSSITRYDLDIPKHISVERVTSRGKDIAMRLHSGDEVNVYPNYDLGVVSIEVPNPVRATVGIRSVLTSPEYVNPKPGSLTFAIGKNVEGKNICGDIAKMPHLLIAGQTGAGKSVCLNTLLISLICRYSPEELRLILVDPKRVEFTIFDNLPHLMINEIIGDPQRAIMALNWAIAEMERRYELFENKTRAGVNVHNLDEYNKALSEDEEKLPKIVIVVDELADLMSTARKDVEDRIQRIAQKARAAGIHLVLATQRPSVDIITGVIKNNLPSRIAFKVPSYNDSRTILDEGGAEKLLGNGDMILSVNGVKRRVQGAFISSEEVQNAVMAIKAANEAYFDQSVADFLDKGDEASEGGGARETGGGDEPVESEYIRALAIAVTIGSASYSLVQRKCSVGYARAGRIIDWMESMGYISEFDGKAKARTVLLTKEEFNAKYGDKYGRID